MTERRRRYRYGSVLISCVLIVAACSSGSEDTADDSVSPTDPVVADEDASGDNAGNSSDTTSTDDNEATTVTDDADDQDASCPPGAIIDLWPGLESTVSGDIAALARDRTSGLTKPNPETCTSMDRVDPVIEPTAVGAAAAASVEHADPYVRYDIYIYESGEAADAATARDVLRSQLPELLPAGSVVQVSRVGQTLFVARSFVDEGDGATREVLALQDYYSALIAGTE